MKKSENSGAAHEVNPVYPYLRLLCCVVFYLIFAFISGPVIGADSRGYIEMISAREPVYPILLWIFRKLLGQDIYLWAVVIFQNILMVLHGEAVETLLQEHFKYGGDVRGPCGSRVYVSVSCGARQYIFE